MEFAQRHNSPLKFAACTSHSPFEFITDRLTDKYSLLYFLLNMLAVGCVKQTSRVMESAKNKLDISEYSSVTFLFFYI